MIYLIRLARAATIGCGALAASMGHAQGDAEGGMVLTFGLNQRFEATTDRSLTDTETTPGRDSTTRLSFSFSDTTRTESLLFTLGSGFQIWEDGSEVSDPRASLRYSRESANAALALRGSWTRSDIAFLQDISDFVDDDGVLVLPDDLSDLNGSGTRTVTTYGAELRWGLQAPLGASVSVDRRELRYAGANASLVDADTTTLGTGLRLNLSPVTTASITLEQIRYEEAGQPRQDTTRGSAGLTFERPLGDISTQINATRTDNGDISWGLTLGRSIALANDNVLNASLGVTQDSAGEAQISGRLNYGYALPEGQISLSAQRGVTTGGPGNGRLSTTLQANYNQALSPLSNVQFGLNFAQISEASGAGDLSSGGLNASYGWRLSPEWQVNLGLQANLRDDTVTRNTSRGVFVGLNRSFQYRP